MPCRGAAAGGVLLEAVVLFDNFDVEVLAEHGGGLAHEVEQDVHADAHIGAVDDGDRAGRGLERLLLVGCKSCCSND